MHFTIYKQHLDTYSQWIFQWIKEVTKVMIMIDSISAIDDGDRDEDLKKWLWWCINCKSSIPVYIGVCSIMRLHNDLFPKILNESNYKLDCIHLDRVLLDSICKSIHWTYKNAYKDKPLQFKHYQNYFYQIFITVVTCQSLRLIQSSSWPLSR